MLAAFGQPKTPRSSCIRVIVKPHTSMSISSAKAVRFAEASREEPTMMRALLLLAAIPTVINANEDVAAPSCVSPATVEPRAPRAYGGDRIVFTAGTDWQTGGQTLVQQYGLSSFGWPAENWNVSTDGVLVSPLTAQQIAQLRCDPVVERIVLGPRTPESMAQERPRPPVRLGITFASDPEGQPVKIGVVVVRVENGSVAERAGLRSNDRIVRFDEHDIVHGSDLLNVMAIKKPGNTVSMVVLRDGVETPLVAQF
jgi:PDZ domain-containing protein